MAFRKTPFATDEWYHCYSRGVDKRRTFDTKRDYERFLQSLYLCNSVEPIRRNDLEGKPQSEIFDTERGAPLVSIAVYSLMPNHFHLLLKEKVEGGISRFMHKVGTAYTMYYNIKNERVGSLFVKPFRSKHIEDDRYLKRVAQYIHLNAAELFEPGWKQGRVRNLKVLEKKIVSYPYSSCGAYDNERRVEDALLDKESLAELYDSLPSFSSVLEDARGYYQELP